MRYLVNDCTDPFRNMAFDQWCLESLPLDEPVFYLWRNRPSVIIGLNQNAFAEVNRAFLESRGIELVRRVTGGGAVYHDLQNLNYTIVGRTSDIERDYPAYASIMAGALASLGVDARVSGRNDIVIGDEGLKVSGFAKRVWRDRLMVHGTIMYDVDIDTLTHALDTPGSKLSGKGVASVRSRVANLREQLSGIGSIEELQERLTSILAGPSEALALSPAQEARIDALADSRFRTWEWNWGHSPAGDISLSAHLDCGTVACLIALEHGCISQIRFTGDYMGSLPPEGLEKALAGCRYTHDDIARVLTLYSDTVAAVFDSATPSDLLGILFPEH